MTAWVIKMGVMLQPMYKYVYTVYDLLMVISLLVNVLLFLLIRFLRPMYLILTSLFGLVPLSFTR